MKKSIRIISLALAAVSCIWLAGCSTANNPGNTPADEKPGFVILEGSLAAEEYGIGFRKGDPTRDVVNAALKVLAADGTLAKISDTWFGSDITRLSRMPRRWTTWIHKKAAPLSSVWTTASPRWDIATTRMKS